MKKIPKWLIILILLLIAILITLGATVLPYQMKETHARNFANKQCEYMQKELHKGTNPEKVKALTQSRITEEHTNNTDIEFTRYAINIDEKNKTCRIDVEMAYGKKYKKFSSKEMKY